MVSTQDEIDQRATCFLTGFILRGALEQLSDVDAAKLILQDKTKTEKAGLTFENNINAARDLCKMDAGLMSKLASMKDALAKGDAGRVSEVARSALAEMKL